MEKSAVILGFSRQANGLPMPLCHGCRGHDRAALHPLQAGLVVSDGVWYGLARVATKVNPSGHHVIAVMSAGDAAGHPSERAAPCFLRERDCGQGEGTDPGRPEDLCAPALCHRAG